MRRVAVAAAALLLLSGCSALDVLNPFSDSSKVKMSELEPIERSADLRVQWQGSVGRAGDYIFTPAVVGGSVYAAARDGSITRYDHGEGGAREVWRIKAGQPLSGGVGADGKLVLVGTPKGEVLAFDSDGTPQWKARVTSELLSAPVPADGTVIVRSGDNRVFALDPADGKRRWVYQRATPPLLLRGASGVTVAGEGVLAGFPGGKLVAISVANGAALWEGTVALPKGATELERVADVASAPVVLDRGVCAVAYQGRVACFDLASGTGQWAKEFSSSVGLDMDRGSVYVTDEEGGVSAFDRSTGASLWKQSKLANRGVGRPLVVGSYVAVADGRGFVHLLRSTDGAFAARVATDGSAIVADLRPIDGGLIAQTTNGGLYALSVQ